MASIAITPDGMKASIVLDGADVSAVVSGYVIEHFASDFPIVTLRLSQAVDVETFVSEHALVRVEVPQDPADAMLEFIAPLDAGEFEKAVLEIMELGGPQTFGEAALAVLKGYASGD